MTIALLCPTRARSEQFNRMIKSIQITARNRTDIHTYVAMTKGDTGYNTVSLSYATIYPDGVPTAHKWNLLAEKALQNSNNKLFMLCSDDTIFSTPLWDKALIDHYNALENKIHVYSLLDSRDPDGTPHPIVTREWIEAMGYFLPPVFLHWFVDSWTVGIARANGCFTHLNDYMLIHDKPSDKGEGDETHNRIRQMGWHERDRWVNDKLKLTYYGMECQRLKWAIDAGNAA